MADSNQPPVMSGLMTLGVDPDHHIRLDMVLMPNGGILVCVDDAVSGYARNVAELKAQLIALIDGAFSLAQRKEVIDADKEIEAP
jgi:hypothetical protein